MIPAATHLRVAVCTLLAFALALSWTAGAPRPAQAAGTPDITVGVSVPGAILLGGTAPVTLTARNPDGPAAYNVSFRAVLPQGVSLASSEPGASRTVTDPQTGVTTVIWDNVSDLIRGTTSQVEARLRFSSALGTGPVSVDVGAYANQDARRLPAFSAAGAPVAGSATGSDTTTASSTLVPFTLTKDVQRPEDEVLRGVHDQKTPVTLRVDNNQVGPSTGLSLVDYLPAQLEFLGCGREDNSAAGTEEYPGSGRLDATAAPPLGHPCPTPSSVDTQRVDPPGPQPLGVYTVIRWDSASLAASLGSSSLATSGQLTLAYVVGVPQRSNVLFGTGGPTAASGDQGSNLDNNTGESTLETTEQSVTNRAVVSGSYAGTDYSAGGSETVTLEDLALQKSVSTRAIAQGGLSTWTLDLQVSEYAAASTDLVVTDTLPDGLCPLGASGADAECAGGPAPDPAYSSARENADGTWTLTWRLADLDPDGTSRLVFTSRTRTAYQENGAPAAPIRAQDAWTNTATVAGTVSELDGPTRAVEDASEAGQEAGSITFRKEVAAPTARGCGDGSALTWYDDTSPDAFGVGETVCWRLSAAAPEALDTTGLQITDFLPAGFAYVDAVTGARSDVPAPTAVVDGRRVAWNLAGGGDLVRTQRVEIILTSTITEVLQAAPDELQGNLGKLSFTNTGGAVFQLRDDASALWAAPTVTLDKSVSRTSAQGGDQVVYTLRLANTGNRDVVDVAVRDLVPPRIGCAGLSALPPGFTCPAGQNQLNGTLPAIAAGATVTLTYNATLPTSTGPGEVFTNRAGVRQFQVQSNTGTGTFTYVPANNIDPALTTTNTTAADDTTTVTAPDATVVKTHSTSVSGLGNSDAQATVGETARYTVITTIPRGTTVNAATVVDTLPATLDLLTTGPAPALTLDGGTATGFTLTADDTANRVTVTFPTPYVSPAADAVLVLSYSAVVRNVAGVTNGASLTNTGTLRFTPPSGGAARTVSDGETVGVVEPDINLTKTEDDADNIATPGELIRFHVKPANGGTSTAYDTAVVDTLPTSMEPADETGQPVADGAAVGPQGGIWDATARTLTWTLGSIDPGTSTSLDFNVRMTSPIVAPTSFTNTATATTTTMKGVQPQERTGPATVSAGRYSATATVPLGGPRLSVSKAADRTKAVVGDVVTYTVVAGVGANVQTYDATVLDTLPAGLRYLDTVSASCTAPAGCTDPVTPLPAAGPLLGWFLGDLAASPTSRQFTLVYRAVVTDVPAVTNGAVLPNGAQVDSNATDKITGTPTTVPTDASFDGRTAAAVTKVTVTEPRLTLDKTVAGGGTADVRRARPGTTLDYTVRITNTGTAPAYDTVVTDVVDRRMVPVQVASGTGWTVTDADPADGTLAFAVPTLAAGASLDLTYRLRVPALTTADEVVAGPELPNTADATYRSLPATSPQPQRLYDDVVADRVDVEVDLASLGDRVWFDTDRDGVQDPGEPGLAGVGLTVTYLGADGVLGGTDDEIRTLTTGADGLWSTDQLPGGRYRVQLTGTTLPAGTSATYDLDGAGTPGSTLLTLGENQDHTDADFGVGGARRIGDLVWLDRDADGVRDAGEAPLAGVGVDVVWSGPDAVLGTSDDVPYRARTDVAGAWAVAGLPAGPYRAALDRSTLPAGTELASDPDGQRGADADGVLLRTQAAGTDDLTVDFGLRGTGGAGDLVWLDRDGDGTRDADEPGVPDVAVDLVWAGTDGVLGTADDQSLRSTTDTTGAWGLAGLPAGSYRVAVAAGTLPSGTSPVADPDGGLGATADGVAAFGLTAGEVRSTLDFGVNGTGSAGDLVWLDRDADGRLDPGEPGLGGVVVDLVWAGPDGRAGTADDVAYRTTTDPAGAWRLAGLPAGSYRVAVDRTTAPAGTAPASDPGGDLGDAADAVATLTLAAGENRSTLDFGFRGTGAVGDRVWLDTDADGTVDDGEPPLGGIGVDVLWAGPDGRLGTGDDVASRTVTAPDGTWRVGGLPAGPVRVTVDATTFPAGTAPASDPDPTVDGTTERTLAAGGTDLGVDFGLRGTGTLGDLVWLDADADGVRDAGEPGLPGVAVLVTWPGTDGDPGTADDLVRRVVTDRDGAWTLTDVPAGDLRVRLDRATLPAGSRPASDPDGQLDGTADAAAVVRLAAGATDRDVDFGLQGDGRVGDLVWLDRDGDGGVDAGEPPLAGVAVDVTWAGPDGQPGGGDDVTYRTVTDATGAWSVTDVPAGPLRVVLDPTTFPAGTAPSSDPDGAVDGAATATLAAGGTLTDLDFGLRGTGSLGDQVWLDGDADGVLDDGEPGLAGVDVRLVWPGTDGASGTDDDLRLTATTDEDGRWTVTDLPAGDYRLDLDAGTFPAGTAPASDPDGQRGGDADGAAAAPLGAGVADLGRDFGLRGTGTVGDLVWLDRDADGAVDDGADDDGEPPVAGVAVVVVWSGQDGRTGTADDVTSRTLTDASGAWTVTGLPAGPLRVTLDRATLPAGTEPASDPDGDRGDDADALASRSLAAGGRDLGLDFGLRGTGSVGDLVWLDRDHDGAEGDGEPPLADVALDVVWYGPDGTAGGDDDVAYRAVTDATGRWRVGGLPAGPFRVTLDDSTLPRGTRPASDPDGTADGTATGDLGAGATDEGLDFGLTGTGSLGDRVWLDRDADGVQDPDEPGLPGVPVEVVWPGTDGDAGTDDDLRVTTTTGADGAWSVPELPAGSYRVGLDTELLPSGTRPVSDPDGDLGAEADGVARVALAAGVAERDVDFGLRGRTTLGDLVWLDQDADGTVDNGTGDGIEPPLAGIGVAVTWFGPDGLPGGGDDVTDRTTTGLDGRWRVTDLPTGAYRVALDPATFPAGTVAVGDGSLTRDVTGDDLGLDFGLRGTGTVGDLAWLDTDRDGTVAATGEPGIPGLVVRVSWFGQDDVLGTADDLVVTTTTGTAGAWRVPGLPQGRVEVRLVDLPASLGPTADEDSGTDGADGVTVLTLSAGAEHLTADFGLVAVTGLGDRVWLDLDADGDQDPGEPGVPGAEVTVTSAGVDGRLDTGDDVVRTTRTTATGFWLVTGLPAGPTRAAVTAGLPDGVRPTADADGTDTPDASVVVLTVNGDGVTGDLGQDFGYAGPGKLGDLVWADVDRDGVHDDGEPGLPGVAVRVTVLGADGAPGGGDDLVVETVTDASGRYTVTGLPRGATLVEVVAGVPAGYAPTADASGDADGTATVQITGPEPVTADFGYGGAGRLGGTVWFDLDADGTVQAPAEPVAPGLPVDVVWAGPDGTFGGDDDVTLAATTGPDGRWGLEGLPPGSYTATVRATSLPQGAVVVWDRDSGSTSPDGVWTGELGAGQSLLDLDTGLGGPASLGDLVWVDLDRDGTRDENEPGLPQVTLRITYLGDDRTVGGGDDVVFDTITDAVGGYSRTGLPTGRYRIEVVSLPKDGYDPTADASGKPDGVATVELASGEHVVADFGYGGTGVLGGRVWFDLDTDGVVDEGEEPPTPGVPLQVTWAGPDGELGTADDVALTAATDADGSWRLEGLPPGTYRVAVPEGDLPPGVAVVFDRDDELDGPDGVWTGVLGAGEQRLDLDDGVRGSAALGDEVWVDEDRDGRQDRSETGPAGVAVVARWYGVDGEAGTPDDVAFSTATGEDGSYGLAGLPAGRYGVLVGPDGIPDGLTPQRDLDGGDPLDTEVDLAVDQQRDDVDFVLVPPPPAAVPAPGTPGGPAPGAPAAPQHGLLGATGLAGNGPLVAGLLLVAAGGALLVLRRRRRGRG